MFQRYCLVLARTRKVHKQTIRVVLYCLVLLSLTAISPTIVRATGTETSNSSIANQIIVQLSSRADISEINASYGTTTVRHLRGNATWLLQTPSGENIDALVARMQGDSRLVYAESNYKASLTEVSQIFIYQDQNSTLETGTVSPQATNTAKQQWAFARIELPNAQKLTLGKGITIALIDSGVYTAHPDLKNHLLPGYNFLNNNTDVSDTSGHGTFVAGILMQVAPEAKILPLRVVDSNGYGTADNAAESLYYAADQGAKIINISLGLYYPSKTLFAAVQYAQAKGAIVVASAGNQNSDKPRYPAAYPQVIGVAATDQQNQKASFSNYGSAVRLSAPGLSLYSTSWQGGYAYGDGTSFAVPQVAGAAALVAALHSDWNNSQILTQLDQTATSLVQIDKTYGARMGRGLINIYRACSGK